LMMFATRASSVPIVRRRVVSARQ